VSKLDRIILSLNLLYESTLIVYMETFKSNSTCQRCGKNSLLTDEDTGEEFCEKCGFVISEKVESSGPEWRSFQGVGGSNSARTGGANITYDT